MWFWLKFAAIVAAVYFIIEWWVVNFSEEFPYDDNEWRT